MPQRFDFNELRLIINVLESNKFWPYPVSDRNGFVNIATENLKINNLSSLT
jgi:hypothetical protein